MLAGDDVAELHRFANQLRIDGSRPADDRALPAMKSSAPCPGLGIVRYHVVAAQQFATVPGCVSHLGPDHF